MLNLSRSFGNHGHIQVILPHLGRRDVRESPVGSGQFQWYTLLGWHDCNPNENRIIQEYIRKNPIRPKVIRADWRGNDAYYTPEDLEWADEDITTPKPGAVPRNREGVPLSEIPEDFDDVE